MILHFVSTSNDFRYGHYLAVLTALKTHRVTDAILWITEMPEADKFFKRIEKLITVKDVKTPDIPHFDWYEEWYKAPLMADLIRWEKLYEYGGLYLDLDTLSATDVTSLLGDKEVCAGREFKDSYHSLAAHCVVAKPKSEVMNWVLKHAKAQLSNAWDYKVFGVYTPRICCKRLRMDWGTTAPLALGKAYKKFGEEKMIVPANNVTCPFCYNNMRHIYKEEAVLPHDARVIHCGAHAFKEFYDLVTPEWIRNSHSPYAVTVKRVLGLKNIELV